MNITKVQLTKLTDSKTVAFANITLDDEFIVTGLRVLSGTNGLWVAMPSKKNKEGSEKPYSDIAFPITKEARQEIQDAVLTKYQEVSYTQTEEQKEADSNIDFTKIIEDQNNLHPKGSGGPVIDITMDDLPFA